ncbi:hypothetical protein ELD05_13630 [Caldicellulosiruptor changbaiensis]|uniref:DUF3800 domain-containing protein n=1 Tax=Caldicellulosiruptor changbaiensis TaxID=1222016 RepID=A0A3T0D8S1_9FIRM|nr:hypothetical protein [Caldicellulosiruptor changbaiensis]AZT91547.1 hypothetical protein ELD05_13630 [Caldicellulosiruptor changbaiensis]
MTSCKVKIFLDESGIVREQKLGIMGALLIPEKVYNSRKFKELMDKFKINNITFHWNELSIHNQDKYFDLLSSLTPFYKFIHANFLLYHYQNFRNINDNEFKQMIYSKFPERVIYGLCEIIFLFQI